MEFKGTKGKWYVSESNEFEKTISSEYFRICEVKHFKNKIHEIFLEPSESEGKANALLISKVPEYHQEILETITDLKILKSNISHANITNNLFNGMPELIQKWIDRKEQLIKEATEL